MLKYRICRKSLWILFIFLLLCGCVTLPVTELQPASIDQYPSLIVSDGPDIDPNSEKHAVPDADILGPSANMKQILDEHIYGISDYRKRFETLLDLFYSNSLFEKTDEKHRTKTAAETFESGTGNCLSFSFAFLSMARYVDLDVQFQEVSTPPEWDKYEKLIFFNRHINVAFKIKSSMEIEIDFYPPRRFDTKNIETRIISDKRAIAQYYNNIGSEYLRDGYIIDAFRYLVKSIKIDPLLSFAWSNLGSIYNRNKQYEAAEKAYKHAININKREFTAMSNLTRLYAMQGRDKEMAYYKRKVQIFRNKNPYYHFALGERAYARGMYDESLKHFKRAIRKQAKTYQFYYELARAYFKLGNLRKAEKSMGRVRKYAPDELIRNRYEEKWQVFAGRD